MALVPIPGNIIPCLTGEAGAAEEEERTVAEGEFAEGLTEVAAEEEENSRAATPFEFAIQSESQFKYATLRVLGHTW